LAISEQHAHPLVIAQGEGADFSLGSVIKKETASTWMALRYSSVPVVVAIKGSVVGWGCELMFHADQVVAALESYISPVSAKMPFPVGGGTKELALRAYQNSLIFGQRLDWLEKFFKQILKGDVSGSAPDARKLNYLKESDIIVSQPYNMLSCAIHQAQSLLQRGYIPPLETRMLVEGYAACQHLKTLVWNLKKQQFISEKMAHQAEQWVQVLAGGHVEAGTLISEEHLLNLERGFWSEVMKESSSVV
jgi:3-hydroxyacyl-CoA dehydrogenase